MTGLGRLSLRRRGTRRYQPKELPDRTIADRFWQKVHKNTGDGCWIWKGAVRTDGYGQFGFRGRIMGAHRVSYILNIGEIPDGLVVCHRCDNKLCVRPSHLITDTQAVNAYDTKRKGRVSAKFGDSNPAAKIAKRIGKPRKLTEEEKEKIRLFAKKNPNWSVTDLAIHFKTTQIRIRKALKGH